MSLCAEGGEKKRKKAEVLRGCTSRNIGAEQAERVKLLDMENNQQSHTVFFTTQHGFQNMNHHNIIIMYKYA